MKQHLSTLTQPSKTLCGRPAGCGLAAGGPGTESDSTCATCQRITEALEEVCS